MSKSRTPIADSIIKKVFGFEDWIMENYNKYHSPEARKRRESEQHDNSNTK